MAAPAPLEPVCVLSHPRTHSFARALKSPAHSLSDTDICGTRMARSRDTLCLRWRLNLWSTCSRMRLEVVEATDGIRRQTRAATKSRGLLMHTVIVTVSTMSSKTRRMCGAVGRLQEMQHKYRILIDLALKLAPSPHSPC